MLKDSYVPDFRDNKRSLNGWNTPRLSVISNDLDLSLQDDS